MRVLLIAQEGTDRGALAVSRALARAGWMVGCGSSEPTGLAAASRSTSHWHRIPAPSRDFKGFVEATQAAVDERGYEVIFPGGDAETLALSAGRDRINACVPYPPHEAVMRAFDKLDLAEGAVKAGLSAPRTVLATDEELARVSGPVVVKSRLHWAPGLQAGSLRQPTTVVSNQEEARQRVMEMRRGGAEPLLQDMVEGRIMHCHAAMDRNGHLITCVKQVAEPLTLPPDGGARVRSQTVPLEQELADGVESFLRDLGWYGFASLQFMQPDVGPPQLADFNGRISLSFEQTIAAGTNFPDLWARVATGRAFEEAPPTRLGVRFQWLEGDLQRALSERRGGLVADVADCLRYSRGAVHGVWKKDDPWPAIRYWLYYLRRAPKMIRELLGRGSQTDAASTLDPWPQE